MSLTNDQLETLSTRMSFPLADIVFKDELPDKLEMNKAYIINNEDALDSDGKQNTGSHWTCLQINKYPNGKIEGIFFDPYGAGMSQDIEAAVKRTIGRSIPHTTKDVQSLLNNACGYFVAAFLHFINSSQYRSKDLFSDVSTFLDMFDDLNKSVDFKKNEYILKQFFRSDDESKRKPVEVDFENAKAIDTNDIVGDDTPGGIDLTKIPIGFKMMK
tara:strand:- start:1916 stop:2560 length:645 start_codon:yes stop_codon:yes gene_type:complete